VRKITVPARVCDGFIGNRIMSRYRREADYMLEDGALPHQVDAAMRDFGFPMGVFQMADLAGLDIGWAMRKRQAATRDPSERYVEIADRICEIGRLRAARPGAAGMTIPRTRTARPTPGSPTDRGGIRPQGITRQSFDADAIMARILSVMQDEGEAILAEGIAATPEAIDVVMVNGFGFPRWRGGPMFMRRGRRMTGRRFHRLDGRLRQLLLRAGQRCAGGLWSERAATWRDRWGAGPRRGSTCPMARRADALRPLSCPRRLAAGPRRLSSMAATGSGWTRAAFSHLAEGARTRGWAVAMPSYTLAPEVRMSRSWPRWWRPLRQRQRIAGPVRLAGHSAGGHLVARMACENAPLPDAVATPHRTRHVDQRHP
jgi:hypothetical protein